ncbi:MAG: carbohydrate ABC transporter permease, partial [Coleofasciculus sp. C2-GNP5-27]
MAIAQDSSSKNKSTINTKQIMLWVGVVLTLIFCLAPAFWQVLTSFKINEAISTIPNVYFPAPDQLTWTHYTQLFERYPFLRYILNSAIVSLTSTVLCLIAGAPAAYALA